MMFELLSDRNHKFIDKLIIIATVNVFLAFTSKVFVNF